MSNWGNKVETRPVTWTMLFILAAVLGIWLIAMALFGLQVATAGLVGRGQAHIQIQSGSNRIAQYNKFFNACGSIQALEGQILVQQAQLAAASDPAEKSRIQANLAGIQGYRLTAIAQYNADASKDYTDGQFRDSDLPYHINADGRTTCAY